MSYLVLARKWRPRTFEALIGQDHVVRALTNALSSGRLHHAWLFTGTRGVGKTTLSRILAKSLNCEQGVTATPCGHCCACTEIDAGRYIDYVELDAASNRGVDEMTRLLEQAVYAPSVGRYKVYMIDEVHMLTGHAFNAMLKTLEEPPEHVKFILATTDPQKIPVTVLSRCLQFNLKQLTVPAIVTHLQDILAQESIPAEQQALRMIAQAAAGSMRDALSLTDQAISYAAGDLTAAAVGDMLGTLDQHHLVALLRALATDDAPRLLAIADDLAARGLSFRTALADLSVLLSRVAIAQRLGHAPADDPLAADIQALAQALAPDETQLFYSVAVHSRQELSLAPDEYAGFVMACLRMLALLPADRAVPVLADPPPTVSALSPTPAVQESAPRQASAHPPVLAANTAPEPAAASETPPAPALETPPAPVLETPPLPAAEAPPAGETAPVRAAPPVPEVPRPPQDASLPPEAADGPDAPQPADWTAEVPPDPDDFEPVASMEVLEAAEEDLDPRLPHLAPQSHPDAPGSPDPALVGAADWPALAAALPVSGAARALAMNSEWLGGDGDRIRLRVAVHSLVEGSSQGRLRTVLSEHFGRVLDLQVEYGSTGAGTAWAVDQAARARRQEAAEQAVGRDPLVQSLEHQFAAQVVPGSVRPPVTPAV